MSDHAASLFTYRAVVGLRPRSRRPIYGTRYSIQCSCGWDVEAMDYISARRIWRGHVYCSPASSRGRA
jgi:hypothetical protein